MVTLSSKVCIKMVGWWYTYPSEKYESPTLWMFQGSPAKTSPKNGVQGQRDTNEAQLSWLLATKTLDVYPKSGEISINNYYCSYENLWKTHEIQRCSRNAIENYENPMKIPSRLIFPAKSCNLFGSPRHPIWRSLAVSGLAVGAVLGRRFR